MEVQKKWQGVSPHRYESNPQEEALALAWQEANTKYRHSTLAYLLSSDNRGERTVSDRDRLVACTIIQWLGSPVGQAFLYDAGNDVSAMSILALAAEED